MAKQRFKRQRLDSLGGSDKEYIARLERTIKEQELIIKERDLTIQTLHQQGRLSQYVHLPAHGNYFPVTSEPPAQQPQLKHTKFVYENPQTEKTDKLATTKESKSFLAELARNEQDWVARRKLTQFSTLTQVVQTFCIVTHRRLPSYHEPVLTNVLTNRSDFDDVAGSLRASVELVKELDGNWMHAKQLRNFGVFLFFCKTLVALKLGVPLEAVNAWTLEVLRCHQAKCDATPEYLQHLRLHVLRWVQFAYGLSTEEGGLTHRGWEMLQLYLPNIHRLPKTFLDAEKFPECPPPAEEFQADIPFEIPFLLKLDFGSSCSLEVINQVFGTNLQEEAFRHRVKRLVDRIEPVFEDLRERYENLKLSGVESAQKSVQRELIGLKLLFGDEPGEDMQERGMFLGDQLWPGVFTEQYSNWVDLEGGLSGVLS